MSPSAVRIEMLGQACVAISAGEIELVTDPWFSGPAHLGSWRAYPELTGDALEAMRLRIDRASHIYISHDHADHFDPEFLATLGPKTILVADFRNRRFRERLGGLASRHTLRVLRAGEQLALGCGLVARITPEQPRFRTNSMLCLQTPFGAILDANDCGISTAALEAIARRGHVAVFLYTLNFMANGYPFPYLRRNDPQLRARMDAIRDQVVAGFRTASATLQPELAVAFAGPVTYADAINDHLNDHPESLDWSRMVAEIATTQRIVWPAPGSVFELDGGGVRALALRDFRDLWRQQPPRRGTPGLSTGAAPDERALLDAAQACVARLSAILDAAGARAQLPLYLSTVEDLDALESERFALTLRLDLDGQQRGVLRVDGAVTAPYLHIVSTAAIVHGFLRGEVTLDDLLLSARARFARDPDTFNATLHNVLRFGHDPDASEALVAAMRAGRRSSATIDVVADGSAFTIPKFCPHEGESLERARICGRRITCPRHSWSFDLDSGACVAGGDATVNLYGAPPKQTGTGGS